MNDVHLVFFSMWWLFPFHSLNCFSEKCRSCLLFVSSLFWLRHIIHLILFTGWTFNASLCFISFFSSFLSWWSSSFWISFCFQMMSQTMDHWLDFDLCSSSILSSIYSNINSHNQFMKLDDQWMTLLLLSSIVVIPHHNICLDIFWLLMTLCINSQLFSIH